VVGAPAAQIWNGVRETPFFRFFQKKPGRPGGAGAAPFFVVLPFLSFIFKELGLTNKRTLFRRLASRLDSFG
jgi:hypothetical protein